MIRRLAFALTLGSTVAAPAMAQSSCPSGTTGGNVGIIASTTGLTGPGVNTFDFNGLVTNVNEDGLPVGNKLAGSGLQFSGAFAGVPGPFYGPFNNAALYNTGFDPTLVSRDFMSIGFSAPTRAVAFEFATLKGPATFAVWLNGQVTHCISATFANDVATPADIRIWGFQLGGAETFDRLTIAGNKDAFGIDNLQTISAVTTVPEPTSIALTAVGLLGVAAAIRRRKG